MTAGSAGEHFDRAREVALLRVQVGDVEAALGGLVMDLRLHPGTACLLTPGLVERLVRVAAEKGADGLHRAVSQLSMLDHNAMLPSWDCDSCWSPWPCQAARGRLLALYDGAMVSLRLCMADRYLDASRGTLGQLPAAELEARFVGWVPDPGEDEAPPGEPAARHRAGEESRDGDV